MAENNGVTFYVVRHGRTMFNVTGRVQGWSDTPLVAEGEEIASAAGRGMADIPFQAVYSSDSGRAAQTAQLILAQNSSSPDVQLQRDPRLREVCFGSYEGGPDATMWADIASKRGLSLPQIKDAMEPEPIINAVAALDAARSKANGDWPAENYAAVVKRLDQAMGSIASSASDAGGGNVLLVSHGLTIATLVLRLFPDFAPSDAITDNAAAAVIRYRGGKYALDAFNDRAYIEKGQRLAAQGAHGA